MLGYLIRQSDAWRKEREAAQTAANRGRAVAAERQHEVSNPRAGEKVLVPPQSVATPEAPKRNHTAESQRKASTALAQQIGTNRGAVERART